MFAGPSEVYIGLCVTSVTREHIHCFCRWFGGHALRSMLTTSRSGERTRCPTVGQDGEHGRMPSDNKSLPSLQGGKMPDATQGVCGRRMWNHAKYFLMW